MAVNTIENNPNFKIDENHSDKIEDSIAKTNNANKVETKKPATTKTKTKDPIQKNFTVEGWPENKSRSAEDYVNYNDPTAILIPQTPFSSSIAGNFFSNQTQYWQIFLLWEITIDLTNFIQMTSLILKYW